MSRGNPTTIIKQTALQVQRAAERLMETTQDWQLIQAFLRNRLEDFELNERQQMKLKRYSFIHSQLTSCDATEQDLVFMLTNKKLYGLSVSQAYEDIQAAKELFGSVINVNKMIEIKLQLESNRIMLVRAKQAGDAMAYTMLEKNRVKLLEMLPDQDENPADHFEGHVFEAVFDPRLLGAPEVDMQALATMINEKRGKKIAIDMFESIPFEEQTPNGNNESPLQQTPASE